MAKPMAKTAEQIVCEVSAQWQPALTALDERRRQLNRLKRRREPLAQAQDDLKYAEKVTNGLAAFMAAVSPDVKYFDLLETAGLWKPRYPGDDGKC